MNNRRKRNEENSDDTPTYSRLFVVCERVLTETNIRDAFSKFGELEDVKMPRDHHSGFPKGIAYVKFAKTSEAAAALEALNLRMLPNSTRPLKVMVACNRSDIQSDDEDNDKYRRVFINIPKTTTESELDEHFKDFGKIISIKIQRDRDSGESKGFAYIKYKKFSDAACAIENCDKMYRAIFALPRGYISRRQETSYEANLNDLANTSTNVRTSLLSVMNTRPEGYKRVHFLCAPYLAHHQISSLFNLIPGMVHCDFFLDLIHNVGKGTVVYSNPISAAYAVEKLNKFEYPPGVRIFVKPDHSKFDATHEQSFATMPNVVNNLQTTITETSSSSTPDLAKLAEAIAEASKLIKLATQDVLEEKIPDSSELHYCSVKLPPPLPLADIDRPVVKRCFLVCKPRPPPLPVLRDVFCRFGDLINVYTLPNKTVGYARYASIQSADDAIKALHGAEICGVRVKVIEAEEEQPHKRMKHD